MVLCSRQLVQKTYHPHTQTSSSVCACKVLKTVVYICVMHKIIFEKMKETSETRNEEKEREERANEGRFGGASCRTNARALE